jgi:hypothetical protein
VAPARTLERLRVASIYFPRAVMLTKPKTTPNRAKADDERAAQKMIAAELYRSRAHRSLKNISQYQDGRSVLVANGLDTSARSLFERDVERMKAIFLQAKNAATRSNSCAMAQRPRSSTPLRVGRVTALPKSASRLHSGKQTHLVRCFVVHTNERHCARL